MHYPLPDREGRVRTGLCGKAVVCRYQQRHQCEKASCDTHSYIWQGFKSLVR